MITRPVAPMRRRRRQALATIVLAGVVVVATVVGADVGGDGGAPSPSASFTSADRAPRCTVRVPPGMAALRRAVGRMRPGSVVCLRAGTTYDGDVTLRRAGTARSPVTLTSAPGPPARILGRLVVARTGSYVVVRDLVLDGRNPRRLPSPSIIGNHVSLLRNDITNGRTGICVIIGSTPGGRALGTTISGNRIHACGRLPRTNRDHGIYVESSRDARITGNVIVDNADRGIQLYPDAQRSLIERNVIDANGVGIIFSGDDGRSSSGNVVRRNLITNSRVRHDVEAYWPPGTPIGDGNTVTSNCIGGGRLGALGPTVGFHAAQNRVGPVVYRDDRYRDLVTPAECRAFLPPPPIGPS